MFRNILRLIKKYLDSVLKFKTGVADNIIDSYFVIRLTQIRSEDWTITDLEIESKALRILILSARSSKIHFKRYAL